MADNVVRSPASMSTHNSDSGAVPAGAGFYLTSFVLESAVSDSTLLAKVPDLIPIIAATFDNGARRTEQFELKRVAEGRWDCTATYRFNPTSPSVSIQIGPSGRLGGLSLPVAQLKSVAGGSFSRPLSLSVGGGPRQGTRFKLTCDVAATGQRDQAGADPLQSLHDQATACFSRFKDSDSVQELREAMKSLSIAVERSRHGDPRLVTWLNELGVYTALVFDKSLDGDLLQLSFSRLQKALGIAIQSHPGITPALQNNVAVVLTLLFHATGFQETDYIHEAIRLLNLATQRHHGDLPNHVVLLTMRETPLRAVPQAISGVPNPTAIYFDSLYYAFFYQFSQSGDPAHLQEASRAQMEAVAATDPANASLLLPRTHRLGTTLLRQVKYFNLLDYLDEAVSTLRTAVSLTPADSPSLPYCLADLVDALLTRFTLKEDLEDIEMAVMHQRKALELTPDDAPRIQLATWWDQLGSCYYYRYDRAGDVEDLAESIRSHQKSVELTEDGDPALLVRLSNLGVPFMSRFEHLGDLDDITEAIKVQGRAVRSSSEDDPKLPTRLNNLGLSLMQRYHHTDNEDDLKDAITHQQRSVALTPPNDSELSTRLHNLVISLDFQLDFQSSPADLDAAIRMEQRAIELLPEDNPNLPTWLNNLGALLNRRADNGGSPNDLEQAISVHAKAVDVTPADHPDLPIWWSNLGLAYRNKFIHTGDIDALQESVAVLQKSIKMTPPDHADLPGWLNNLCSALDSRFDYTGDREDLEGAIEASREALRVSPTHRTSLRTTSLHNLGTNLYVHFTRFLIEEDLEESIRCLEEAVTLLPEEHAEFPAPMRALADARMHHFEHFGTVESLHIAIANLEKVVSIMAEEQVMYRSHLSALGSALASRFELTGDQSDWERAIEVHMRSIDLTPNDHPDVTLRYNSLGYSYLGRQRRLAQEENLKEVVSAFRKAAMVPSGTWMTRLIAAREWAKYAPNPNEALDAYRTSVELISVAASLRFTIQRRHQHLLETADISRAAAATALSVGKVEQALEWLEQGRGLVWSQLSQLRAPIEALRAQHPELAERFIAVSKGLESAGAQLTSATSTLDEKIVLQKKTGEQGKHAKEWEELLATIRAIPEFIHFLRPSPFSDLLSRLPGSGYAVVVNVHPDRCDAIVLSRDFADGRPLHVPLESFSFKQAESLYGLLRTNLAEAGVLTRGDVLDLKVDEGDDTKGESDDGEEEGAKQMEDGKGEESSRGLKVFRKVSSSQGSSTENVLRSLWTLLVEPIVKALSLTQSASPQTRIWWCTTGVLSFLPIHAAGIYRGPGAAALADYAVSSYIPTVAMLTERARETAPPGSSGLLLVSQPDVPGMSRIPGTVVETELIKKRAESAGVRSYRIEKGDEASPEVLMESMQQYSCIHLACHASQSTSEPLASGFYLHGGRLQLSTIIQARLTSADVAFLSACQTSTGNEDLSEEAVHLAAGMMAAGYRGVVAAMWSIQDRHGARVADDFYEDLFARSADVQGIDGSKAAYSLHYSVQKLRKQLGVSEASFLAWVPYVHFGL